MDPLIASLAMSVCDLLVTERAKFNATLQLLQQKGLLTSAEIGETIRSIESLAPELVAEDFDRLQRRVQQRMEVRLQELLLHSLPSGPTQ